MIHTTLGLKIRVHLAPILHIDFLVSSTVDEVFTTRHLRPNLPCPSRSSRRHCPSSLSLWPSFLPFPYRSHASQPFLAKQ
ncbi:hypothetical protein HHX47_DHR9000315 [Lentinula edodes]|nr:hypothetical protein HHX47_DHR9000315 [Lentinula edodes]